MQGLYVDGLRPKSKKAVKEAIVADPSRVRVEATSWFGNEYDGNLTVAQTGTRIDFVGPDPHTDRRFYGNITVNSDGTFKVT